MNEGTVVVLLGVLFLMLMILAPLPGSIAKSRNHPNAEAINMLGWLGMLFGGVLWIIALVWAHSAVANPVEKSNGSPRPRPIPMRPPEFEVIGNKGGKQVRLKFEAADQDEARFLAAEQQIEVQGLRKVRDAMPEPGTDFLVAGTDTKTNQERSVIIRAMDRQMAYKRAVEQGLSHVNTLEPMPQ